MTEENEKITPLEAIRLLSLSGMFTPETAVNRLALVNLLARYLLGDAEEGFVRKLLLEKCGMQLAGEDEA
jgi:hypothetical protein